MGSQGRKKGFVISNLNKDVVFLGRASKLICLRSWTGRNNVTHHEKKTFYNKRKPFTTKEYLLYKKKTFYNKKN